MLRQVGEKNHGEARICPIRNDIPYPLNSLNMNERLRRLIERLDEIFESLLPALGEAALQNIFG